MEEERLIYLLRGLPRETAHAGFTSRVLARLDRQATAAAADSGRPAVNGPHRLPSPQPGLRWPRMHRAMVATATVAALGISVGVSVGLLQRERSPERVSSAAAAAPAVPAALGGTAAARTRDAAGGRRGAAIREAADLAVARGDRVFRHEGEGAARELPPVGLGPRTAANRPGAALNPADAARMHQLLRELQLESVRLERELRSLRRPGGGASSMVYLGGDEDVDLVLNPGKMRITVPPPGERDDGENLNYL